MFLFLFSQLTWINALVLLAAAILGYVFWFKQTTKTFPPFPIIPLPIIGSLYHPGLLKDAVGQLIKWKEKFGDVYSVNLGRDHYVVLHDYDSVREALVTQTDKTSSRPEMYYRPEEEKHMGISVVSGDEWKERRMLFMASLKNLEKGKNLENYSKEEVRHLLRTLDKAQEMPVNFGPIIMRNIMTLMFSFLVGECYDVSSPMMDQLFGLFQQAKLMPLKANLLNAFPWIKHLPFDPFFAKEIVINEESLFDFSNIHIKKIKSRIGKENPNGFIESYLDSQSKKVKANKKTHLSERDLNFILEEMYIAGADTVSNSLSWWALQMVHFPEVQEKAFQEIKNVIGLENLPTLEDRPMLKYSNSMILESLRLASPTSITLPHLVDKPFTLKGYTVPKGSIVVALLQSVHENDALFDGNAADMKPERFIDDTGNVVRSGKSIPFSLGRRACPGQNMALQVMFFYTVSVLQRFRVEPVDPNNLPSKDGVFNGLSKPPPKFEVKFVERYPNVN